MIRLKTLAAIALSGALASGSLALAQPAGSGGDHSVFDAARAGTQSVIDIDFEGGNLLAYFEHLQQRNGVRNIVLGSEELAAATMPEVKLSAVLYADAVKLANFLAKFPDDRFFQINEVGSSKSIFVVSVRDSREHGVGSTDNLSIDFQGGSLADFVKVVQEVADEKIVLVRGDASSFSMPPIQLENVSIHGVLQALDGDTRWSPSGERMSVSSQYRQGVYVVEVVTAQPDPGAGGPSPVQTSSWTLIELLGPGRLSTDDVLSAIEAAIEVSGTAKSTQIRFHEPSSLLIASGPFPALELIDLTLDRLEETASDRFKKRTSRMELEAELIEHETRLTEFAEAIERAEEIVRSFEAGEEGVRMSQAEFQKSRIGRMTDSMLAAKAQIEAIRFKLSQQD